MMSAGEEEKAPQGEAATQEQDILQQAIELTRAERPRAEGLLKALTEEALKGALVFDKNVGRTIKARISELDALISQQLAAVMHTPEFQKLEGTWRGMHYLVMNSETGTQLKLRLIHCTKDDALSDFENAVEFDQSELWKKLYETEFGSPGGRPYGALIGDYEFNNHPNDMLLLSELSKVAAGAFCPFISAASPELFGFGSWTELSKPRDLAAIFDSVEYVKWNSFRNSEDSRFVTLTLPRTLARLPYGAATKPIKEFAFEEVALGKKGESIAVPHDQYCWMNTAFVMGARMTDAFAKTGFCTAIRGYQNGGKVEGLPAHIFTTDEGDTDMKCPTEIGITDRREKELSDLGFLSLGHYKNEDYAVFFGAQTTQKPKSYYGKDAEDANANARISARLPYIMATSRFAHYLKVIGRDWIGSFKEKPDLEKAMHEWIMQYVSNDPNASEAVRARYPLREARVQVREIPGEPGSYNAVCFMRPWLQLEELTAAMSMVARIPEVT
jgi:type VI secretion system protein ImpC